MSMQIFTDGSCLKNPGPGGFGVVQINSDENKIINWHSERKENTTNNEMELYAIYYAYLRFGVNIHEEFQPEIPEVFSDSAYAINTITDWAFKWRDKGWIKSDGKVPENLELIKKIIALYDKGLRIDLKKVKGHSGIEGNEIADKLATGQYPSKYSDYLKEPIKTKWKPIFERAAVGDTKHERDMNVLAEYRRRKTEFYNDLEHLYEVVYIENKIDPLYGNVIEPEST